MPRRSARKTTIFKTKHSESLQAAVRYKKQQAQAKKSIDEEFKRLSSCLGTIVDSEDSAKIINLVSEESDQVNLPNINDSTEDKEVFVDYSQDQSVNLPSLIIDQGVVLFGNRDCSISVGINRVDCSRPSATTPERRPFLSVTSPHLPQVPEDLPAMSAMDEHTYGL